MRVECSRLVLNQVFKYAIQIWVTNSNCNRCLVYSKQDLCIFSNAEFGCRIIIPNNLKEVEVNSKVIVGLVGKVYLRRTSKLLYARAEESNFEPY